MNISPLSIDQSGPGIDLSNQPDGVTITMSDPVEDFEYARNTVTLTYDLSGMEHVRLGFSALEYGDEPHYPNSELGIVNSENEIGFGPVADFDFDGVAISADGVDWYEIQNLRELRSDRFTEFDLDLDALAAASGIGYTAAFGIRFCQYDNNPAPMDGFTLAGIGLTGDTAPYLRLAMDDDAANATVADSGLGGHDQTFVDPTGDPNTSAHTTAGQVGAALAFDGVDDRIPLSAASYRSLIEADKDFTIAFWWKPDGPNPALPLHIVSNYSATESSILVATTGGNLNVSAVFVTGSTRWVTAAWTGGVDSAWHHHAMTRQGTVLSFYRDGALVKTDDNAGNTLTLAPSDRELTLGSNPSGAQPSPGAMDEFRVYGVAIAAEEIEALAGVG